MGEIKRMYPEGQINEFDLKRDIARNTAQTGNFKVLDIKTANEWIEDAKSKPIPLELLGCLWYQGASAGHFAPPLP